MAKRTASDMPWTPGMQADRLKTASPLTSATIGVFKTLCGDDGAV